MDSNTFKTKTGFCHILPDKIVLTRDGVLGNMAQLSMGNNIARPLLIYTIGSVILLYLAYDYYKKEQSIYALVYLVLASFFLYIIATSFNNSATPLIERKDIQTIKFKRGIQGLTRCRFEVVFRDKNNKLKKRLILLPGSFNNGASETEHALTIMKNEGLLDS